MLKLKKNKKTTVNLIEFAFFLIKCISFNERITIKMYITSIKQKQDRRRLRLTYTDQSEKSREIRGTRNWRGYIKVLMNLKEAKEVCRKSNGYVGTTGKEGYGVVSKRRMIDEII